MITQATKITGERAAAERTNCEQCGVRAAIHVMRMLNDGWTLQPCASGYILTPPTTKAH